MTETHNTTVSFDNYIDVDVCVCVLDRSNTINVHFEVNELFARIQLRSRCICITDSVQ